MIIPPLERLSLPRTLKHKVLNLKSSGNLYKPPQSSYTNSLLCQQWLLFRVTDFAPPTPWMWVLICHKVLWYVQWSWTFSSSLPPPIDSCREKLVYINLSADSHSASIYTKYLYSACKYFSLLYLVKPWVIHYTAIWIKWLLNPLPDFL